MNEEELPSELRAAVEEFVQWATQQLRAEDESKKVKHTLYHYTNGSGLRGIIESQKLWFTSHLHLNDPSELTHGMNVAHGLLREISESVGDGLVKMFCDEVDNRIQNGSFAAVFGYYIASLSSAENDLGLWRAYADNGRGFALGLAPHLFEAIETPNPKPTEHIVMPVVYGKAADQRYRAAIEAAAGIVQSNHRHLRDKKISDPFISVMANRLIAHQLIGVSLGVKHEAYCHEREVRLIIFGPQHSQKDDVRTRIRGSEIVPYMESSLPLRDKDGIVEIVLGPAASPSAKDAVQRLLQSFGIDPDNRIRESGIPYRAL